MTFRSVLVHVQGDSHCAARTEIAVKLACQFDGHVVGVAPTGLIDAPIFSEVAASLVEYTALVWDSLRDQAEAAATAFRAHCRRIGFESFESIVDECEKAGSIVRHAHCSDLAVLTQAEPGTAGYLAAREIVEQVVIDSARPTLVVPYAGRYTAPFRSAVVAWDDSREASRALSDALPLLRQCKTVKVLAWREADGPSEQVLRLRLEALNKWLLWQGVASEVHIESTEIDIASALLARAADLSCDLLVMGAYGHARFTERILGGATRGVLRAMTVPTLLSH